MISKDGKFKKPKELSREETQAMYLLAKYAILNAYRNGIPKGDFIKNNLGVFKADGDFTQEDLQFVLNALFSFSMKKAFGKDRSTLGFQTSARGE